MAQVDDTAQASWARLQERGAWPFLWITRQAMAWGGRLLLSPMLYVVVLYFFLTGRKARASAREYQQRLAADTPGALQPSRWTLYRQFLAFGTAILDKLDAWMGRIKRESLLFSENDAMEDVVASQKGVLIFSSHWGNVEVTHALGQRDQRTRLHVLVHTANAVKFNRMLHESAAQNIDLIHVTEISPETAILLSDHVAKGDWVVIAADRIPVQGERTVDVHFLGHKAPLPLGPYVLARLLQCPVYTLFCWRDGRDFRVEMTHLFDPVSVPYKQRTQVIEAQAQAFADRLASMCRRAPYQWFNFYPFWSPHEAPAEQARRT